jgi:hypothetical protein
LLLVILLELFFVFYGILVLGKKTFGLIMDEVAEHFKAVSLLDSFFLEQFSNGRDASS